MTGTELRNLRQQMQLTQQELADRIGVHKNTVARWERDELSMRSSMARLLEYLIREHADRQRLCPEQRSGKRGEQ